MKYFLTFDGAPHSPHTERILDILKHENVKATFFIEGHRIKGNEALLKRIISEGHGIGNHTFTHRILTDLSTEEALEDIDRCDEEIYRVTQKRAKALRPPYGKINVEMMEQLSLKGYQLICWNTSVKDFLLDDSDELARRLFECRKDYVVPVVHDSVEIVPLALEKAIPLLKEKGVSFEIIEDYL